jgi:hypothetical protein
MITSDSSVRSTISSIGRWHITRRRPVTSTTHYLLNHSADIDGDDLFVGTDREPANHITISGGRYVDRLERRDGRWAIVDRVCIVEFNAESQSHISEEVIAMMVGMPTSRQDPTDPSYARPLSAKRRAAL